MQAIIDSEFNKYVILQRDKCTVYLAVAKKVCRKVLL